MDSPKLIVILGQTAAGKTKMAIGLAKKFNGEIISADSRQVYKEMEIGVSKPTKKERENIPHHLIGIVKPDQEFNVALYKEIAIKKIKEVNKRQKLPFLVGGTGLYISSIINNLYFPKVTPDKKLRKKLESKTKKELLSIYKKTDPEGYNFIEKGNKRRLIRAIEVCKKTKNSFWKQREKGKEMFDILKIGIKKNNLKKIIEKRTEKMIKQGLEKEAKELIGKYGNIQSLNTIGYKEWKEYLKGEITKIKVKELINLHTLQFAKRQMTWFKKEKDICWIKEKREAIKLISEFIKN